MATAETKLRAAEPRLRSWGQWLLYAPAALIGLQTILFYSFVLRARLRLGYWPEEYNPDPKELGFDLHHEIIWIGLWVTVTASPILFLLVATMARKLRRTGLRPGVPLLLYLGASAVGLLLFVWNPGQFGWWYLD